jgi:hypothetical protein
MPDGTTAGLRLFAAGNVYPNVQVCGLRYPELREEENVAIRPLQSGHAVAVAP